MPGGPPVPSSSVPRGGRQGHHEAHASRGSQFEHERPEKLFGDVERAAPARKFVDFFPIDVAAIETVAGARVGHELRPQIINLAAFTDALPELAQAIHSMEPRGCSRHT